MGLEVVAWTMPPSVGTSEGRRGSASPRTPQPAGDGGGQGSWWGGVPEAVWRKEGDGQASQRRMRGTRTSPLEEEPPSSRGGVLGQLGWAGGLRGASE